ncbi:MAG: chorismate synthase [Candidatus Omnitrophica bacterium]|nr:chorismate synthase [Candidatus Omnitrophota bacterium]
MKKIRFLTAGESHGPALMVILEGVPAGLALTKEEIDRDLSRRQHGFGRGGRMAIERDEVEIISGLRKGLTLGTPVGLLVRNRDWENWKETMAAEPGGPEVKPVVNPRPGHADLSGALKFGFQDIRNVIERASARETAARVAAAAVVKKLLLTFGIDIYSRVVQIGTVCDQSEFHPPESCEVIENSRLRCLSADKEAKMVDLISQAREKGDTLGGVFEVKATGLPVGLGSYTQWDLRLDGLLARALMSIPAVKGVEIGEGFRLASLFGSKAHDEIFHGPEKGFYRKTNRAGGLEAGITNGQPLVIRAAMKPISTLGQPLTTVDIISRKPAKAIKERSDVCAVPAAGIVGEAMVAFVLADAFLEKFGGDSIEEIKARL